MSSGIACADPLHTLSPELLERPLPTSPFSSSSSSAERGIGVKAVVRAVNQLPSDGCSVGRHFRLVPVL